MPDALTAADRRGLVAALAYSADHHPNGDPAGARALAEKIGGDSARDDFDRIRLARRAERRAAGAAPLVALVATIEESTGAGARLLTNSTHPGDLNPNQHAGTYATTAEAIDAAAEEMAYRLARAMGEPR